MARTSNGSEGGFSVLLACKYNNDELLKSIFFLFFFYNTTRPNSDIKITTLCRFQNNY